MIVFPDVKNPGRVIIFVLHILSSWYDRHQVPEIP